MMRRWQLPARVWGLLCCVSHSPLRLLAGTAATRAVLHTRTCDCGPQRQAVRAAHAGSGRAPGGDVACVAWLPRLCCVCETCLAMANHFYNAAFHGMHACFGRFWAGRTGSPCLVNVRGAPPARPCWQINLDWSQAQACLPACLPQAPRHTTLPRRHTQSRTPVAPNPELGGQHLPANQLMNQRHGPPVRIDRQRAQLQQHAWHHRETLTASNLRLHALRPNRRARCRQRTCTDARVYTCICTGLCYNTDARA